MFGEHQYIVNGFFEALPSMLAFLAVLGVILWRCDKVLLARELRQLRGRASSSKAKRKSRT